MNAQLKYSDIINLPHHVSNKYPHLSREQKAAQFAPFAALTGFDDDVKETARLTDRKIDIDEGLKEIINDKLNQIIIDIKNKPNITITYFIKDSKKKGGKYITEEGIVKKINVINKYLLLENNNKILFEDILEIKNISL